MFTKREGALVVSIPLKTAERVVLGLLLTAAQAVLINIPISTQAHTTVEIGILAFLAAGVKPLTNVAAKLPVEVVTAIGILIASAQSYLATLPLGSTAHTIIAIVLCVLVAFGLGARVPLPATVNVARPPDPPPPPSPPPPPPPSPVQPQGA